MTNPELLAMLPTVLVGVVVVAVIGAVSSSVRKKTALLSAEGRFEVRHPKAVAVIGLICMLVFAGFLVMSMYAAAMQGALSGQDLVMVSGVFGFFFLMGAALLLMGVRWRLEAGEDIVYVPALGRVQVIPYEDIRYARQLATKYKVYDNYHRHLFTVEQSCVGGATLLNKLRNNGIPLYREESFWQVLKFRATYIGKGRKKTYLPKSARQKQPDAQKQREARQREYQRKAALPPDLPENLEAALRAAQRNTILLAAEPGNNTAHRTGASKLGGMPDLPEGFQWGYYEDYSYDNVLASRPLAFLLQLDCAELRPYDKDNLLPTTGLLSFFYELDSMRWEPDTGDKGYFKVYYFDGPASSLLQTSLPQGLKEEYRIPECRLRFCNRPSFPSYAEFSRGKGLWNHIANSRVYEEALAKLQPPEQDVQTCMLGYPDSIQNDVFDDFDTQWHARHAPEDTAGAGQWQLLLQLDSLLFEQAGAPGIMFGDCGAVYFGIRQADLQCRAFDRAWFTLQCY